MVSGWLWRGSGCDLVWVWGQSSGFKLGLIQLVFGVGSGYRVRVQSHKPQARIRRSKKTQTKGLPSKVRQNMALALRDPHRP